jgi:hypothetical protein
MWCACCMLHRCVSHVPLPILVYADCQSTLGLCPNSHGGWAVWDVRSHQVSYVLSSLASAKQPLNPYCEWKPSLLRVLCSRISRSQPLSNSPHSGERGMHAGTGAPPYGPLDLGGGATRPTADNKDAPVGSQPAGATFVGERPCELLGQEYTATPLTVDGSASTEGAGTLPLGPAGTAQDGAPWTNSHRQQFCRRRCNAFPCSVPPEYTVMVFPLSLSRCHFYLVVGFVTACCPFSGPAVFGPRTPLH